MHTDRDDNSNELFRQVRKLELKIQELFGFPVAIHNDNSMRLYFVAEGDVDWTKALMYLLLKAKVSQPKIHYNKDKNSSELSVTIDRFLLRGESSLDE